MGYDTRLTGSFSVSPDLTCKRIAELNRFASKRHEDPKMPGYYCPWIPNEEGTCIEWDGNERPYDYVEWIRYLLKTFLIPWGHTLNGKVRWDGEEQGDVGIISIENNVVTVKKAKLVLEDGTEL